MNLPGISIEIMIIYQKKTNVVPIVCPQTNINFRQNSRHKNKKYQKKKCYKYLSKGKLNCKEHENKKI